MPKSKLTTMARVRSSRIVLPRRTRNGLRAWTAAHYNKAADAVMNAIGITPVEWGEVRSAIRDVLETPKAKR